ncbi:MAG: hypothetical protein JWM69_749, partial [Candidatus Binatus sp.]|nr:hypothetical protein [Candidatus Binatus sp.]
RVQGFALPGEWGASPMYHSALFS